MSINADGAPLVRIADGSAVVALVLQQVPMQHLVPGAQVLVAITDDGSRRAIIIGAVATAVTTSRRSAIARVDGKRVEITGDEEVVLTCGRASITLTRAGKVLIKGSYVTSGSGGVNRITGASVQIN